MSNIKSNSKEEQVYTFKRWKDAGEDWLFVKRDVNRYIDAKLYRKSGIIKTKGEVHATGKIIKIKTEKGNEMDVDYVGSNYKVVETLVDNEETYFKIDLNLNVVKGDLLVVETNSGYEVATVERLILNNFENSRYVNKAKAWVVNKVDTTKHEKRRDADSRKKWIMSQLVKRKEEVDTIITFEMVARIDEETDALLNELKSLINIEI